MYFHGASGAGRYAQFAHTAFILIEVDRHFRSFDRQRTGWAYGSAGATMSASFSDAADFLGRIFYVDSLIFEIFYTFFEILSGTRQLHHHQTLLAGQNGGVKYIERQVIVFGQKTDNRFLSFSSWETKSENA